MTFDFNSWLAKHTSWEGPDSGKIFGITKDNNIFIADYDWEICAEGKTLKEACLNYDAATLKLQLKHKLGSWD